MKTVFDLSEFLANQPADMVNQSPLFYLEGFIYFLSKRWLALRFLNHQQSDSSVWKGRFTFWTYNHHPFRNALKRKMSSEPKLQGITEPSRSSSGAVGVIRLWSRCFPESILQVTAESTSSKEAEVLLKRTKGVTMAFWKCFFWRIFVWKSQMLQSVWYILCLHLQNQNYTHVTINMPYRCVSFFWFDPCVEITILVGRYVYNLLLASQRNPSFWETTLCSSLLFRYECKYTCRMYIYIYTFFFYEHIYLHKIQT